MKRRSPRARAARSVVVALLLAAVTTLAVAWGAVLMPWNSGWRGGMSMSGVSWWIKERWGDTSYQFKTLSAPTPLTADMMDNMIAAAWEDAGFETAAADCRDDLQRIAPRQVSSWIRRRAGWPFACLEFVETAETTGVVTRQRLVALGSATEAQLAAGADDRRLPVGPMWAGLLGNVALYLVAWFALVGLVPVVRSARAQRRKRRGQCERCGYDLRGAAAGTACPECGGTGRVTVCPKRPAPEP